MNNSCSFDNVSDLFCDEETTLMTRWWQSLSPRAFRTLLTPQSSFLSFDNNLLEMENNQQDELSNTSTESIEIPSLEMVLGRSLELQNTRVQLEMKLEQSEWKMHELKTALEKRRVGTRRDQTRYTRLEDTYTSLCLKESLHLEKITKLKKEAKILKMELQQMRGKGSLESLDFMDVQMLETQSWHGLQQIRMELSTRCKILVENQNNMCILCCQETITTLFLPCRHQIVCKTCASKVEKCPIDRTTIQNKIEPFGNETK